MGRYGATCAVRLPGAHKHDYRNQQECGYNGHNIRKNMHVDLNYDMIWPMQSVCISISWDDLHKVCVFCLRRQHKLQRRAANEQRSGGKPLFPLAGPTTSLITCLQDSYCTACQNPLSWSKSDPTLRRFWWKCSRPTSQGRWERRRLVQKMCFCSMAPFLLVRSQLLKNRTAPSLVEFVCWKASVSLWKFMKTQNGNCFISLRFWPKWNPQCCVSWLLKFANNVFFLHLWGAIQRGSNQGFYG